MSSTGSYTTEKTVADDLPRKTSFGFDVTVSIQQGDIKVQWNFERLSDVKMRVETYRSQGDVLNSEEWLFEFDGQECFSIPQDTDTEEYADEYVENRAEEEIRKTREFFA